MKTPIHSFLKSYAEENPVRCHMPGGKDCPFDITEIEGADSLFESSGIIKQSEENASRLFGSGETLYSCGGSTLSIQTMLAAAKAMFPEKTRIAASEYCHKSLVSACVLLNLKIDRIKSEGFLSCRISPEAVEKAISEDTLCVFVQSIDYYGGECDIKSISDVCRQRNMLLLVDNAHGAYRVFTENHPLRLGADMTADSAHKTLPCLTGTSYLHISSNAPKRLGKRAKELMSIFGSSSPSYLMLDSLDLCNRFISEKSDYARKIFNEIQGLKENLSDIGFKLRKSDLMKITLDANAYGYSGYELSSLLRENKVAAEYCDSGYAVLLFSVAQPLTDFDKVFDAARSIPKRPPLPHNDPFFELPPCAVSPRDAIFSDSEELPVEKAEGRICGSILCPCPPCVPLILPGEIFTRNIAAALKGYGVKRVLALITN